MYDTLMDLDSQHICKLLNERTMGRGGLLERKIVGVYAP